MRTFKTLVHGAVVTAAIGLAATSAFGFGSIGNDVNAFCASNPYTGSCNFCHLSDRSASTPAKTAAGQGDFCFFCPDDAQCAPQPACTDADGDGYFAEAGCGTAIDCNDNDPGINPGAAEVCTDARDNDCNGAIDGQDDACIVVSPPPCFDGDGDGWCVEDGDCNDTDPEIYPGATDICLDGVDQDCSGADRTKGKGCAKTSDTTGKIQREGKGRTCSDGLDNDGDGDIDCDDSDCSSNRACR